MSRRLALPSLLVVALLVHATASAAPDRSGTAPNRHGCANRAPSELRGIGLVVRVPRGWCGRVFARRDEYELSNYPVVDPDQMFSLQPRLRRDQVLIGILRIGAVPVPLSGDVWFDRIVSRFQFHRYRHIARYGASAWIHRTAFVVAVVLGKPMVTDGDVAALNAAVAHMRPPRR